MPFHKRFETEEVIDLPEFLRIAEGVDVSCTDGMLSLAEPFTKLGNNRTFLAEYFAEYIKQAVVVNPDGLVLSQSVVLSRNEKFYIRANVWLPENDMTEKESLLFAYNQAHDHNFDLLSLAYCGDGYYTDCFEYDYESVEGYVGELVEINPLGRIQHTCGDTLLYVCNKDIHFQRPPVNPSVTLNLIPLANQNGLRDQYFFNIADVDSVTATIYGYPTTIIEQRRSLFEIAKHFADDKIVKIFIGLAEKHPCRRTRYEALRSLKTCNLEAHNEMCMKLRDDNAQIIRTYVESSLL